MFFIHDKINKSIIISGRVLASLGGLYLIIKFFEIKSLKKF